MRTLTSLAASATLLILMPLPSLAQAPRMMSFQGFLTDTTGTAIQGQHDLTIRIYDRARGGSELWNRTHSKHAIIDGVFNILLDRGVPHFSTVAFVDSLWLQVEVDAQKIGSRTRLTASPYAMGLSRFEKSA